LVRHVRKLWDWAAGKEIAAFVGLVAYAPDGKTVVVIGGEGNPENVFQTRQPLPRCPVQKLDVQLSEVATGKKLDHSGAALASEINAGRAPHLPDPASAIVRLSMSHLDKVNYPATA
jgi:hypothetical protein